jgi:hypothetical protein
MEDVPLTSNHAEIQCKQTLQNGQIAFLPSEEESYHKCWLSQGKLVPDKSATRQKSEN